MPINGGTRMLRARRKDINVKPNRRLDRKSSRGMLFENEELRMRTITINAEVEQGQHALKKLRRENEQLRREMWSLRDEYDKMEKLLRKKETDEDSDQENSDSDEYSQTEDSEEEQKEGDDGNGESDEKAENSEGAQGSATNFGNLTTARAFDGLSVIDEQTEETTTQTTESVIGCSTASRGNSANRTLNQVNPAPMRMYQEHSVFFDPGAYPKMSHRKKPFPVYENDAGYVAYSIDWPDNGYDCRPASPYPYPESVQPTYRKRFEVLQNLHPAVASRIPEPGENENGWLFPAPTKPTYDVYRREEGLFVGGPFIPDNALPISVQIPRELDYDVIQSRAGPDVFVTDVCAKKNVSENASSVKGETGSVDSEGVSNVRAEIDKIDINEKPEENSKNASSHQTWKTKEGAPGAKLITKKTVDKGCVDQRGDADDSVPCQNSGHKDAYQTFDEEEMAKADKAATFQSKLKVTLKTPIAKPDARGTLKRVPPVQVPRTYRAPGYGIEPEDEAVGKRCGVEFPECRYVSAAGPGLPAAGVPAPMTEIEKMDRIVSDTQNIPGQGARDGIGLLAEAETTPQVGISPTKPVKIPPAPPPRTTSCLGTIIPDPAVGVATVRGRTFRREKSPVLAYQELEAYPMMENPLLLSEPMASSSPTISQRIFQHGYGFSLDNLSGGRKPAIANEESSTEDVSIKKTRAPGRRPEPPPLNKSLSSPSFGTFLRRKPSEVSTSSIENGNISQQIGRIVRGNPQNNVSVSSSSGLDSPTKSDRRKRRVSIKFNKKVHQEDGSERASDSKHCGKNHAKSKGRHDETDATTSERERTNSVSSRGSSGPGGSGRRKLSVSSNRTFKNDEKIPWCGCWGNGCV